MNSAIMQLKIEKSKLEKKFCEHRIKIMRLLNELAALSCPYFETFEDIKVQEIEQIGDELLIVTQEAIDNKKKIKQINKDLGCE